MSLNHLTRVGAPEGEAVDAATGNLPGTWDGAKCLSVGSALLGTRARSPAWSCHSPSLGDDRSGAHSVKRLIEKFLVSSLAGLGRSSQVTLTEGARLA